MLLGEQKAYLSKRQQIDSIEKAMVNQIKVMVLLFIEYVFVNYFFF